MDAKRQIDRLIFVFSADSGSFNAFMDNAKKVLRIKGCTLCAITHGLAGEKTEWRECKEELGVQIDYVHRDEISEDLRRVAGDNLPCVVAQTDGDLVFLLGPDVLERCRGSVADLKGRLRIFAAMRQLELPEAVEA